MSLKGEDEFYNPSTLEKVLTRAENISDRDFRRLTGFTKSDIQDKIQKLKRFFSSYGF